MAESNKWQLLFVDDDEQLCGQVKEYLEGETLPGPDMSPQVTTYTDFNDALNELETRLFDLVILDVRLGPLEGVREEEAGITTLETIRQKRFVPVVFYTGLPRLVEHLTSPLIQVVEKTEGLPRLLATVRDSFATRLPAVNRALIRHLEAVQREYMWGFVAEHWGEFGGATDRTALAHLLARRLAMSLSGSGVEELARDLGGSARAVGGADGAHPMRYYVMPPVQAAPLAGDLYRGAVGGDRGHWVLLTPSCDFAQSRVERALLTRCTLLIEEPEYQQWQSSLKGSGSPQIGHLRSLLRNNRQRQPERYYYLPGALALPDLVVDFQRLVTIPCGQLDELERLASLDSPFAEALLARFARYLGRLGTPDLDVGAVITRLKSTIDESAE